VKQILNALVIIAFSCQLAAWYVRVLFHYARNAGDNRLSQ